MGRQVSFSRRSRGDLKTIVAYVASDNIDAALKLGEDLIAAAESLADFPLRGKPFGETNGRLDYELPCRKHRIFFQIDEERGMIEVLHIRSGMQSEPGF